MTAHDIGFTDAPDLPGPEVPPHRKRVHAEAVTELAHRLRTQIPDELAQRVRADAAAERPAMTPAARRALGEALGRDIADEHAREALTTHGVMLPAAVEQRLIGTVLDEVTGLGPLGALLADDDVETININGADAVFVRYADGRSARVSPIAASDDHVVDLIRELAARSGVEERRFDRAAPIANFSLAGGERVSAVMALTARPSVSIRRHRVAKATLADLRCNGTIDPALESFLTALVRARRNVLVTGGTGIGKTTLLRAMAAAIPPWERLITIEDVVELGLGEDSAAHPNVVALQAREPNVERLGEVSLSDLVWQSLRMSPDRVIVGEVRGPEVIPLTNAMSMGNDGSMSTLHSSSSRGAFTKLAAYAVQGPERLPLEATNLLVASALHFVVHLDTPRGEDGRRVVSSIREVIDADGPLVVSNEVWRPRPDNRAMPGAPLRTDTLDLLVEHGYDPSLADHPEGWGRP